MEKENSSSSESSGISSILEGMLPQDDIAEIVKEVAPSGDEKKDDKPAANTEEGKPAPVDKPANEEGKNDGSEQGEEGKKEGDGAKPEIKNVEEKKGRLGLFGKAKKSDVVIENPEDIISVVNSKYGQNLKEIKDLPKFLESVDKFRTSAQKADALEQENLQFRKLWEEELPDQFIEAAKAYLDGKDYLSILTSGSKLNFSVPVEKQDIKSLVNEYFPKKFTDEDFEEKEVSPALEIAIEAAKDKYKGQQEQFDAKRAQINEKAILSVKAQKEAVLGSVGGLVQAFPEVDQADVSTIQKVLEGGPKSVMSFFFDEKGVTKPEAAKSLFMAMYGEEELKIAAEIAANQAEGKVNEEILTRGADTKKPVRSNGNQQQQVSKGTQDQIRELEEIETKQRTNF